MSSVLSRERLGAMFRAVSTRAPASSRLGARVQSSRRVAARAEMSSALAKTLARETTREYAKSFFMASQFMPAERREQAYALYAWCRELDQIVDGSNAGLEASRRELDAVAERLRVMFDERRMPLDATYADVALYDAIQSIHGFSREPFDDMVRGMRRDLEPNEGAFETFDDVATYAYEVAGTVALMILPILTSGTAADATSSVAEERCERGVALGIALQLTNIVRDVGEDARKRGRVYISTEDLALFGLTREDVLSMKTPTPSYMALMEYQVQRALGYYDKARDGVAFLPLTSRPVVACIGGLYKRILLSVRANGYDNLNKRAFASKVQKILALPSIVIGSMIGASEDGDGNLNLDFSDGCEKYRASMCALFVAVSGANDAEICRCVDTLRTLQRKQQAPKSGGVRWKPGSIWYASKQLVDFGTYEDSAITVAGGTIRRSCST